MVTSKKWFIIINPTSGNGSAKKLWPKIKRLLSSYRFNFKYTFTAHQGHSVFLVQNAIIQGFKNIIAVGGDGTLHNIINGVMSQDGIASYKICIGVIPIGSGNDWVKTYGIPKDIEKAIQILKNGKTAQQDLGKIEFINQSNAPVYFNNLAGVGFDGYVVNTVGRYKHFGAMAYLLGAIRCLFSFKNFETELYINSKKIKTKSLMVLIGLCKYSGGGMQLTKLPVPSDGLFDISIAGNFTKLDIIKTIFKLFNGSIVNFKKVQSFKTSCITVKILQKNKPYIQADGESIGSGDFKASIQKNAFLFYCK